MNKFALNPRLAELAVKRDTHRAIANEYFESGSTIQEIYHRRQVAEAVAEIRRICHATLAVLPSIG